MGVTIQQSNLTSTKINVSVVEEGLSFYLDPLNREGYPGSGTTLNNVTSNENIAVSTTATLNSAASIDSNNYISFNGTAASRVNLSENVTLGRSGATLMWWMATSTASTNQNLFSIGAGSNPYNRLIEYKQTSFYGETNVNCNDIHSPTFTSFSNNEWRHIAVKFDSNSSYWYLDGSSIGETPNYGLDTTGGIQCEDAPSTSQMVGDLTIRYIGGSGGYSSPYNGKMSQIMIYNRSLSNGEILRNFTAQRSRY